MKPPVVRLDADALSRCAASLLQVNGLPIALVNEQERIIQLLFQAGREFVLDVTGQEPRLVCRPVEDPKHGVTVQAEADTGEVRP